MTRTDVYNALNSGLPSIVEHRNQRNHLTRESTQPLITVPRVFITHTGTESEFLVPRYLTTLLNPFVEVAHIVHSN